MPTVCNAFTIDLEDWGHGLLGGGTPITRRVVANVERVLELLDRHRVKATFFALGKVCRTHPQLLTAVAAAGHEVASHGYGHELVYRMTPQALREDLRRSIDVIGEQTGRAPVGYRAPGFSITRASLWALDVLADLGFRYSSSIFPFGGRRYGIAAAPRFPFRCGGGLIEFPLTTLMWGGRRWPVCGGGYLRLLPMRCADQAIRRANRLGQPAVLYMHPYELDLTEVSQMRRCGFPIRRSLALQQGLFRVFFRRRVSDLLRRFQFAPMRAVLGV